MIFERFADVASQGIVNPGLGKKAVDCSAIDGCGDRFEIGIAGEHDANGVRVDILDSAQEFRAARTYHPMTANDNVNVMPRQQFETFGCGLGGKSLIVVGTEQASQRRGHIGVIVNDQ